ncbi:MAG: hypothetical protein JST93_36900 [Acidobacteria bacterium]|nr:hypothetical protein [Acidobacteriota bacterium]
MIDRRTLTRTLLFAAASSHTPAQQPPAPKLVPWMYMIYPLEQWLTEPRRILDAWESGGVRGIVIGPLRFWDGPPTFDFTYRRAGATISAFAPDPAIYRKHGVDPPENIRLDPAKEKQLHTLLDDIRRRGWELMLFGPGHYGRRKSAQQDPFGAISLAAGVEDTLRALPQATGVIIDGAGEHHYELAFHHGGDLFEIRDHHRAIYTHLGFDITRMERGMNHLKTRFHSLTPSLVRFHQHGGMLGGMSLFDLNEDALYWLRMRQESTLRNMAAIRTELDRLPRKTKLGTIPRSAAFSVLTTQDYEKTHRFFDYIFPKHYYWHRGFDGMYGTVARWVATLKEWNPTLTEEDCFAVVKLLFGLQFPGVRKLADLENGFPDEFFNEVVFNETRRALDATGDPNKVIAWVSTGRNPHAGDPMPAHDLNRLLVASHRAGLKRFIFHPDVNLGAAEWKVISRLCGKEWNEDPSGYWPADTPKPDTWNGGRKPPAK